MKKKVVHRGIPHIPPLRENPYDNVDVTPLERLYRVAHYHRAVIAMHCSFALGKNKSNNNNILYSARIRFTQ